MLLSELAWMGKASPYHAAFAFVYARDGRVIAVIHDLGDGTYSIPRTFDGRPITVDALTAQSLLFEITREGNDAA